jgi:predicted membrane-bound spermidine synthase
MKNHYIDLKVVAFFSGAIIMVLEILGFRMLAPYFGYSIYVYGSLIGIVMVALSLGYFLGGLLADRRPKKAFLFKIVLLADIFVIIISFSYAGIIESLAKLGVIYGSIASSVTIFAPGMILLAMVPPFIIKLIAKDASIVGSVAGDITAIGTVGSILGTFGATFILIPKIGSHWTLYICSLVLLFIAIWGLAVENKKYLILLPVMFVFNIFPGETEPNIVFQKESPYNLVKVIRGKDGKLFLKLNDSSIWVHSIYNPESELVEGEYYDYMNIAPIISDGEDILILGMGAGTSARQFLRYFNVQVDAVEIDPLVIDVGKKYFGINEDERFRIYEEDARPFLQNTGKMYDVIEVDVYHGGVYAPFYVLTREFFQSVYNHLKPSGVMVINVLSPYQPVNRMLLVNAVGKTINTVFPSVYKIEMFLNHLLFATKSNTDLITIRKKIKSYNGRPEMKKIALSASGKIADFHPADDAIIFTDDRAPVAKITYEMISSGSGIYR